MPATRPNVSDPGRIVAHRGASQEAPENTLAAFRTAAGQGAYWVEFDVSLLGDATPVIHHDATFDRCTSATGPLTAVGRGALAGIAASAGKDGFEDEPLPDLVTALDQLEALEFYANLEMKPHDTPTGQMAAIVAQELAARPWTRERIIVSSFVLEELAALRGIMPDVPIAVLYVEPPSDWRRSLDDLNAAALHFHHHHLRHSLLTEAASFGFDTRIYTANDPELVAPFREFGLTGIITDHPPFYLDDPDWAAWAKT